MTEMFSPEALTAFFQVVMIDLVLAGDNAVVIGLAAAGLHESQRNKAILAGIFAATILRIGFASITVQLLEIMDCCWPAAFSCFGCAGRCGASCAPRRHIIKRR